MGKQLVLLFNREWFLLSVAQEAYHIHSPSRLFFLGHPNQWKDMLTDHGLFLFVFCCLHFEVRDFAFAFFMCGPAWPVSGV